MASEPKAQRIAWFEQACRERGLPVTTQRRAVLEVILGRDDHPTADQIYDLLKNRLRGLSRATVYRILDTLVQLGIVSKIGHSGSAARFDPKMHRHHHLVCMQCERIIDLESKPLDRLRLPDVRAMGFTIQDYHIHFRGLCADCGSKRTSTARTLARRGVNKPALTKSAKRQTTRRGKKVQR